MDETITSTWFVTRRSSVEFLRLTSLRLVFGHGIGRSIAVLSQHLNGNEDGIKLENYARDSPARLTGARKVTAVNWQAAQEQIKMA